MFNFFKNFFPKTENDMLGFIAKTDSGFELTDSRGRFIASYTRMRDLRRGAKRRGLEIA